MVIKNNKLILFCIVIVGIMSQAMAAMDPHQNGLIRLPCVGSTTKSRKEFKKDYNCILKQNASRLFQQMSYATVEERTKATDNYITNGQSNLSDQLRCFDFTTSSTATNSSIKKSR